MGKTYLCNWRGRCKYEDGTSEDFGFKSRLEAKSFVGQFLGCKKCIAVFLYPQTAKARREAAGQEYLVFNLQNNSRF